MQYKLTYLDVLNSIKDGVQHDEMIRYIQAANRAIELASKQLHPTMLPPK